MSEASVAMRVCSGCYGIEEETAMFRCANCAKFLCGDCRCKCDEPKREPAGGRGLAETTFAGRVSVAIAKWFT